MKQIVYTCDHCSDIVSGLGQERAHFMLHINKDSGWYKAQDGKARELEKFKAGIYQFCGGHCVSKWFEAQYAEGLRS